jgi:cytochrome c peroxidase
MLRLSEKILMCAAVLLLTAAIGTAAELSDKERLGEKLFFDNDLSTPPGQACAACHAQEVGWTGPESTINAGGAVYPGAVHTRFGNRKPPSAAYGGDSPTLDHVMGSFTGGMFWDGRATGWALGDPLAEQAMGPFLNPLEQNNPNEKTVVDKVLLSDYSTLFKQVCGSKYNVKKYYVCIAESIAAYESSAEVSAYTSKYDKYLAGEATLTDQEGFGLTLFIAPNNNNGIREDGEGGNCAACHLSEPGLYSDKALFTDFTYDNLGVPKNPQNPFYTMPRKWNPAGYNWVDMGLGGFLDNAMPEYAMENYGKHKVPTLRNVDLRPDQNFVKAYSHNGYFKSLEEIVHFYNTRDVSTWPTAEVPQNINTAELGNLGLCEEEEAAIVAFLKTLSDGYTPTP